MKPKFKSFGGSKWIRGGPWTLKMEARRLKMEAWSVRRPVITDLHYTDEKDLDSVQDPH